MNAFTTKEYTAYYTRLPAVGARRSGSRSSGDVLTAPALRDEDVESERQVILEELNLDEDTHDDKAHTLVQAPCSRTTRSGWETAGERDTVIAITPDDVRAVLRTAGTGPATTVVAAAGALDHDAVVAEVERRFTAPGGGERAERAAHPATACGRSPCCGARSSRPTSPSATAAWRATTPPARPSTSSTTCSAAACRAGCSTRSASGGAWPTRCTRRSRPTATPARSSSTPAPRPAQVGEVLDLVDGELAKLLADGPTDDELDVAKGYLVGSYLLGLEDPGSRMARLGAQLTCLGEVRRARRAGGRVPRPSTRDDVAAVIDRVLCQPRALVAVGPVTKKVLTRQRVA